MQPTITITPVAVTDSPELYRLISHDMASLKDWLPWAKRMTNVAKERHFLTYAVQKQALGQLYMYTIRVNGHVAGAIDLHNFDSDDHHAEIGYWLADEYRGQGVMATSLRQLESVAQQLRLHVLLILTDIVNVNSQRVAQRGGYKKSGLIPDYLYDGKNWHDCLFFSKVLAE